MKRLPATEAAYLKMHGLFSALTSPRLIQLSEVAGFPSSSSPNHLSFCQSKRGRQVPLEEKGLGCSAALQRVLLEACWLCSFCYSKPGSLARRKGIIWELVRRQNLRLHSGPPEQKTQGSRGYIKVSKVSEQDRNPKVFSFTQFKNLT